MQAISTPLDVCEARDSKGLYARARLGDLRQFTGITDPYEFPCDAELRIDATHISPEDAAQRIVDHIEEEDYMVPAQQVWPAFQVAPLPIG